MNRRLCALTLATAFVLPSLLPVFCAAQSPPPGQQERQQGPAVPAPVAGSIPEGKGSTTGAGKFVPAAAPGGSLPSAAAARTVKPEDAEKQLRAALKVQDLGEGKYQIGKVKFDAAARTVSVPAKVNMRGGIIEYALTTEAGKAHEAMLTTTASPRDLHLACLLLGMKGSPVTGDMHAAMTVPAAQAVQVSVAWETNGPAKQVPLAALLGLARGGPGGPTSPMTGSPWHYTGSRFAAQGSFAAETDGSFISLIRDDTALVNTSDPSRDDDAIHVPNTTALPAADHPVTVIFQLPAKS